MEFFITLWLFLLLYLTFCGTDKLFQSSNTIVQSHELSMKVLVSEDLGLWIPVLLWFWGRFLTSYVLTWKMEGYFEG